MTDASAGSGAFDRRGFIQLAAAGAGLAGAMRAASAPRSERLADITPQPNPSFADDYNTADILVETLIAWWATHAFGVLGDGGFAMLMAEVTTAVANNLPVKVIILKNGRLAEVKFEQLEIGKPEFGCALAPIDFVAVARACGAEGFRCTRPEEVRPAIQAALAYKGVAVVEAVVDADEKPAKPDDLRV
jgi:hypothetical protein